MALREVGKFFHLIAVGSYGDHTSNLNPVSQPLYSSPHSKIAAMAMGAGNGGFVPLDETVVLKAIVHSGYS